MWPCRYMLHCYSFDMQLKVIQLSLMLGCIYLYHDNVEISIFNFEFYFTCYLRIHIQHLHCVFAYEPLLLVYIYVATVNNSMLNVLR